MEALQQRILEFMAAVVLQSGERFPSLALDLFAAQFERNAPYRRFCLRRGKTPETVREWTEIPAVPISAFKAETLACFPADQAAACFMTSGTTGGAERRGRHYHPHLRIWDASMVPNFKAHVVPDLPRIRMLVLHPDETVQPNSSLAHYLTLAVREFGAPGSAFYVDADGLHCEALLAALRQAESDGAPVALLGTPFAYVHFLDWCAERSHSFRLPPGSRVFDTGGFKGKSRELAPADLCAWYGRAFGVGPELVINMYGMTELSTQFYDALPRSPEYPRVKVGPPWIRTRVVDPVTLAEVPAGQVGILAHYDLGSWASVLAILTEDAGYRTDGRFVLLGRASGEGARGCAAAMDEFLQATGARP